MTKHVEIVKRAAWRGAALTCAAVSFVLPTTAYAQAAPVIQCQGRPVTEMSYTNPTLIQGNALQVGAVYRFNNVATNVNALVEITAFVNGGRLASIDNAAGLPNYFQPQLIKTTAASAVDFKFWYEDATTGQPIEMDFAASVIDVDGNSVNIREYAEFSDNSVAYVLNDPTELDRNASGPTPGRNRYEARNFTVAPGIDPTAEENIATVFYTDTITFDYRIGALGPGSQTRFTSLGFNCPNLTTPVVTPVEDEDYGDALLNNYGNPIHTIVPGIRLGANNTIETSSGNSATASGDAGDDGVTLPNFIAGQTATVTVDAIGSGGYLQAWVDWNNDGDILDAGEQVATNVQDTDNDGIITLDIPTPNGAVIGNTIARFRWSTAIDVGYQEPAEDGEVEDYQITVLAAPNIVANKSVVVYDPANAGLYALPGNDVVYTIMATNTGEGTADNNSIEFIDSLPTEIAFWNGDIDDGGPETDPVSFTQSPGTGLTFNYATDVRFGTGTTKPADFASCTTVTPDSTYRPDLTFICFNPKGAMAAGDPDPAFSVDFRARIK